MPFSYNRIVDRVSQCAVIFYDRFYKLLFQLLYLTRDSLVAFSISCFDVPYKNTIYFLFAVLVLMPFQVLIVPNYFVLRWTNLLNTPWALLLPGFFGPFAVFLIRQYMITIPKSLIEATAIDGGNYWSAFLYVVVPVSKPAIIAASTLLFADIWNMVEQPLALLEDYTLFPLSMSLIDSSKTPGKSAFAAIVLFMIPPSLLYLYYTDDCNGVQREHNKKLNNGLPILHKVPPKRDYGRYFCIMTEKGGTSHGGLTEKLSPFFHAKKQEVNAYGR